MSRGLNKVMIIGNLGREPEMRYTPSGHPVTTFNIGANRRWKASDGGVQNETEWFHIVTWGNLAEICKQRLNKGQQVYVEGRLRTRSWDDSSGHRHTSTEIVANEMIILGNSKESSSSPAKKIADESDEDVS